MQKLQTEIMAIVSVGSGAIGTTLTWVEVANEYLQAISFIVSIAVGVAGLHSWWKRRKSDAAKKD